MGRLILHFCLIVSFCTALGGEPGAQSEQPTEYEVKAAYLFNFARFIEWPAEAFEDSTSPITIGILGEDPFGQVLEQTIDGKTVRGRPIVVLRSRGYESCHILFIGLSEKKNLNKVLERLSESSTLTVSDLEDFATRGGMVGFVINDNKIRFEINVDVVERSRLEISSKLLKVAEVIREGG
jgi:hypothetical protein